MTTAEADMEARIEQAVAAERERCAKIAEDRRMYGYVADIGCFSCFKNIAVAIRSPTTRTVDSK